MKHFSPIKIDGDTDIGLTVHSSGTTDQLKLVSLTHEHVLECVTDPDDATANDVMLCYSPLSWITGCLMSFRVLLSGAKIIITHEMFSPELTFRLIEKYRVTYTMFSPLQSISMFKNEKIHETDLSSVRRIVTSGTKLYSEMLEIGTKYFPNGEITAVYGLSETAGKVAVNLPCVKGDTVGRLTAGMKAKIIDGNKRRLGPNENGEICLLMPYKFKGYFNNPEETAKLYDSEGFLCTGDVGHFDTNGNLYVVDRKQDFIQYKNPLISPTDVEDALIECDEIQFVCVTGIPNDEFGELPTAIIQLCKGKTIDTEKVKRVIAKNFPNWKILCGGIYFIESFPRTPSGKVLRREGKKIALKLYNEQKL